MAYAGGRLKNSINVCVPSTLLKRASFGADKLTDMLATENEKQLFRARKSCTAILAYDADALQITEMSPISLVLKKILNEGTSASLMWLKGGYKVFSTEFPDLCESAVSLASSGQNSESSPSPPFLNLSSPKLTGHQRQQSGEGNFNNSSTTLHIGSQMASVLCFAGPLTAPLNFGKPAYDNPKMAYTNDDATPPELLPMKIFKKKDLSYAPEFIKSLISKGVRESLVSKFKVCVTFF